MLLRPQGRSIPDPTWQIHPGWYEIRQYHDGMVPGHPQACLLQPSRIILKLSNKPKKPFPNSVV